MKIQIVALVVLAKLSPAVSATNWCALLDLSDQELFDQGLADGFGTHCFIQDASGTPAACDYYVKGRPSDVGGDGLPLTTVGSGSGCVDPRAPDLCYYRNADYLLTQAERDAMCTEDEVANAAAQIRYGIRNGLCDVDPAQGCFPTSAPTTSPIDAPVAITCADTDIRRCVIHPDPHFNVWESPLDYDFHGGCDMIAIDNPMLRVHIRTRPRGSYSTITQVAIEVKAAGEVLWLGISGAENTIGNSGAGPASYAVSGNRHTVSLGDGDKITLYQDSYGLTMVAEGCPSSPFFGGSKGMCGSWDGGGASLKDGTPMDLSGSRATKTALAAGLAQSWKIETPAGSLLKNPSDVCDPSASCGRLGDPIRCSAVRSRRLMAHPGCTRTCAEIHIKHVRDHCDFDVRATNDPTWACAAWYVQVATPFPPPTRWCELLTFPDQALYDMGVDKWLGKYCFIYHATGTPAACDFQVRGRPDGAGNDGIPLAIANGDGCVDDFGGANCKYNDAAFPLTQEERDDMCTGSRVANAAAQLRYGIRNGYCTDDPREGCLSATCNTQLQNRQGNFYVDYVNFKCASDVSFVCGCLVLLHYIYSDKVDCIFTFNINGGEL
mmetsp:Transcript_54403/g.115554  ORF Transcript_54403/g.115554 Transcript_54403/m.115554 type:complete len:606 (-) Transcript_54403:100-1917(-)